MPSITHWGRLEPRCRSDQFDAGLAAQVRDPAWMLARQWQFGEFTGDDAGSPVDTALSYRVRPLEVLQAPDGATLPLGADAVWEAAVEGQPVPMDLRTRTQAGLQFARLLRSGPAAALLSTFLAEVPLTAPSEGAVGDDPSRRFRTGVAGRVVDGGALLATLRQGDSLADLLPAGTASQAQRQAIDDAAEALIAWFRATYGPEPVDCWDPARLRHTFTARSSAEQIHASVVAPEYPGGRLDWSDVELRSLPDDATDPVTERFVPTSVRFAGMPSSRWWEFEDARTDFGAIRPNTTDLAALMLADFALIYADDWFVAPLQVPAGALITMVDLVVTDTFGERTRIAPAEGESFAAFRLSDAPGADLVPRGDVLLTAPATSASIDGRPIEEVTLFRDEMANVAWGVEDFLPNDLGEPTSGYDAYRRQLAAAPPEPESDAVGLHYRLMTEVAANWLPFQAIRDPAQPRARALELTPFLREAADGTLVPVLPRGALLRAADPYRLDEEALPRTARSLTRSFQRVRTGDGHTRIWLSRRQRPKRPQAGSGLEFDQLATGG